MNQRYSFLSATSEEIKSSQITRNISILLERHDIRWHASFDGLSLIFMRQKSVASNI